MKLSTSRRISSRHTPREEFQARRDVNETAWKEVSRGVPGRDDLGAVFANCLSSLGIFPNFYLLNNRLYLNFDEFNYTDKTHFDNIRLVLEF